MFYLKRNVPNWERALRLGLGLLFAATSYNLLPPGAMQWGAYLVAASLAGTGLVGFCPACAMVGRKLSDGSK